MTPFSRFSTASRLSRKSSRALSVAALSSLALGALAGPAAAGEGGQGDDGHHTVITAERGESTVFDTARMVLRVGAERLEALMPEDGPAALMELPGVLVQRTNRGAATPIMRGLAGPQNLLLVDGVRFNTSTFRTGPNQYAALTDPLGLEAIEVMLGPGSALYGSDAMGGTINYLTRGVPDREGVHGRVDLTAASADLGARLYADVGYARGPVAGWVRAGGRLRQELRAGGGDTAPISDYSQLDLGTKWRLDLGRTRLTLAWLTTLVDHAGRADRVETGDLRTYDNQDHLGYLKLEQKLGGLVRLLDVTASVHILDEQIHRWRCARNDLGAVADRAGCIAESAAAVSRTSDNEDGVVAAALSGVVEARALEDRLKVKAGVDLRSEWISSLRADAPEARGNFSDGSTYGSAEAFLWAEGRPVVDPGVAELVLNGAIRATGVFASAADVPGLGDVDYDFFGLVGGGSARVLLAERLNVYAGVWQGFRAPNLQETTQLGDTGSTFELPNDDLGPERSTTFEGGFKVITGQLRFGANVFQSLVTDAIVTEAATHQGAAEVDGKPVRHRTNATEAEYKGVEALFEADVNPQLTLAASLAVIDGDITKVDGTVEAPRRLPPIQGSARASYRPHHRWALFADLRWAAAQTKLAPGDERDLRICADPGAPHALQDPCDGTPGWVTFGVGASYRPIDAILLRLRVDNLLDARYRTHGSGYDAAGVNVKLGGTLQF